MVSGQPFWEIASPQKFWAQSQLHTFYIWSYKRTSSHHVLHRSKLCRRNAIKLHPLKQLHPTFMDTVNPTFFLYLLPKMKAPINILSLCLSRLRKWLNCSQVSPVILNEILLIRERVEFKGSEPFVASILIYF